MYKSVEKYLGPQQSDFLRIAISLFKLQLNWFSSNSDYSMGSGRLLLFNLSSTVV